ncbi:MAG TPA: calx-beta domain protein, partial [Thermoanaerobaculia bacterium]
ADRPFDPVLWKSDGTPEGTAPLPGPNGLTLLNPTYLQVFAGRLVFTTPDGGLWQSDGTTAGTVKIRDLAGPGESGIGGWVLVPAGSRLFLRSFDHDTGEELWAVDGP